MFEKALNSSCKSFAPYTLNSTSFGILRSGNSGLPLIFIYDSEEKLFFTKELSKYYFVCKFESCECQPDGCCCKPSHYYRLIGAFFSF